MEKNSEIIITTPEELLKQELQKSNVTDSTIAKWEEEYLPLKIDGSGDRDGYKKVFEARKQVQETRIMTAKFCKKGRERAIQEQKDWIAEEKRIVGKLETIETHLKSELEKVDKEVELAEENRKQYRIKSFVECGVTFDGKDYWNGTRLMTPMLKVSDAYFEEMLIDLREQKRKKEELVKQEQERMAREKAEHEAKQKELAEAEEKLRIDREKFQAEMREHQRQKLEMRSGRLMAMGMMYDKMNSTFSHAGVPDFTISVQELEEFSAENFEVMFKKLEVEINKYKEEQIKIAEDQAKLEAERELVRNEYERESVAFLKEHDFEECNGGMRSKITQWFIGSLHYSQFDTEDEFIKWKASFLIDWKKFLETMKLEKQRNAREVELRPYIIFIRDYKKLISMEETEYQKEFSDIKKGAEDHWEHEFKERQAKALAEEKDREEKELAAIKRREARMPDKEKVEKLYARFIDWINDNKPAMKTDEGKAAMSRIQKATRELASLIQDEGSAL